MLTLLDVYYCGVSVACTCLYIKMAAWVHDLVKTDIKDVIYEAFEAVVKERFPSQWEISEKEFSKFLRAIRIKQVESDGKCSRSGQSEVAHSTSDSGGPSHGGSKGQEGSASSAYTKMQNCFHSHRIHLCIQGDYEIRQLPQLPALRYTVIRALDSPHVIRNESSIPGTLDSDLIGLILGSVVGSAVINATAAVSTFISGVLGGTVASGGAATGVRVASEGAATEVRVASGGTATGVRVASGGAATGVRVASGGAATGVRASRDRLVPSDEVQNYIMTLKAVEVFRKLDEFSVDKNGGMCYCVITKNTVCPYQECTGETVGERVLRGI